MPLMLQSGDGTQIDQATINQIYTQSTYLKGENTEYSDEFGYAVAIDGDTLVIGAMNEDGSANTVNGAYDDTAKDAGAAYVFVNQDGAWEQQAYLKASNAGACDYFGYSVAIAGDTIVVGAIGEASNATGINGNQSDESMDQAGAAYVFVREGSTWTQQAYLKASNTHEYDNFGNAVAISGDTLVVGAPYEWSAATGVNGNAADRSAVGAGAAYVFTREGTTWSQQAYLKASNTAGAYHFGMDVDISEDTIVVGSHYESAGACSGGAQESGSAYVFTRNNADWSQQAYLKASNCNAWDHFGISVAVSGDHIVVGANSEDGGSSGVNGDQQDKSVPASGAAYVFAREGTTWSQEAYLKSANPVQNDEFARSVDIDGDLIVVGIPDEDTGANESGGAYIFCREDGNWAQQDFLKTAIPGQYELLGWSVSTGNGSVIVGTPFINYDSASSSTPASQAQPMRAEQNPVQIQSTVSRNGAYVFSTKTAPLLLPQISISGNQQTIANGDSSPSEQDNTDFGTLSTGEERTFYFTIHNQGTGDLTLTGDPLISINGAPSDQFSLKTGPALTLAPDAETTFSITFHPSGTSGVKQATVNITSNSSANSTYQFEIKGTYTPIALKPILQTTSLQDTDFGILTLGEVRTLAFAIRNTGTADLVLSGSPLIEISSSSDGQFSLEVSPSSPIAPGAETSFRISFHPSGSAGSRQAMVTIHSNDSANPSYQFTISGAVQPPPPTAKKVFLPILAR